MPQVQAECRSISGKRWSYCGSHYFHHAILHDHPLKMTYQLRYCFDLGSGTCLWADNDPARAQFDYAIDHHALPLSRNTLCWLDYLLAWFDTAIDWDSPATIRWSSEERARFHAASQRGLALLRAELSSEHFSIIDATQAI